MIKIKAIIAYDGSKFYGIQKQKNKTSIQESIENALLKLNITSNIEYSGRTDKHVHALNQVISFYIPEYWKVKLNNLKDNLNRLLLPYIYIKKLEIVDNDFHPRFSAKKRSYRYILSKNINPFNYNYITYYPNSIDYELIENALNIIIGIHDFEYFAKTGSNVNNYIREIYNAKIIKYHNKTIIKLIGNGFLRSQIRIIINFLLMINEKKLSLNDLKNQLEKNKLYSKKPAPPNGLYLERIFY